MNEEIIFKYLSGEISENEKQQLKEWLQVSAENRYYFFELKSIWQAKNNF
ncbi:MAG: hypothetical protein LIP06_13955 [Tannerellaceae bacterium]|nr:hypothetical protein [Tannerellaceae bacterium]